MWRSTDMSSSTTSGVSGVFSQPTSLIGSQPTSLTGPPQSGGRKMPSMSGTSSGQDLASLFTDLDPLGTGKSKPFVDKKDFFSDSKTSPKMRVPELNMSGTAPSSSALPSDGGLL